MAFEPEEQQERLRAIINRFQERRIVVVGDAVADRFLYGEISRVSREAPVLILRHERTETIPGGAANCAANLAALGARVALIAVVGEDEAGRALLSKLDACGVETKSVRQSSAVQTTTKVRILAGQLHSPRQQVIRVDYEGEPLSDESLRSDLRSCLMSEAAKADAVIISDYNYGVADALMAGAVRASSAARNLPVLVDSRFRLSEFKGFTSGTPNEDEVEQLLGISHTELPGLEAAGEQLRAQLGYRSLLITRGSHGMVLLEEGAEALHIEAVGALEAVDGTGAGDTVIAAYTLALASGATFADAAQLANHAGGLVVMKRGTASVNQQELLSSVLQTGKGR
ncbi:MAG TPA: bifunctional ADP-heptose synthase [Pyrinomonadaceae bacterium]|nr:bifunctional ADP-heptose synthase [Pyrinomonadaceae bacterium]